MLEGPLERFGAHWRFTLSAGAAKVEFTLEYEFASRVVAACRMIFSRLADSAVRLCAAYAARP
jgi:ribosome-associated toxin RatA of RatAB toxin-antitoxin module